MKLSLKIFGLLSLVWLSACKKDKAFEPPPPDTKPAIRRIAPVQSSSLDTVGALITLNYILADNQQLKYWKVVSKNLSTGAENVELQESISGTYVEKEYEYEVPSVPNFTDILITAFVYDNMGNMDSVSYKITKDFIRDNTQPYRLLSYRDNQIFNRMNPGGKSAFSFITRSNTVTNNVAKDIAEMTNVSGDFKRTFTSPNSAPNDTVFVVLDTTIFNYNEATYTTIRQAYLGNLRVRETRRLNVGDIVITRLRNLEEEHYAVMLIKEVYDDGPTTDTDYIKFDYKRSEN